MNTDRIAKHLHMRVPRFRLTQLESLLRDFSETCHHQSPNPLSCDLYLDDYLESRMSNPPCSGELPAFRTALSQVAMIDIKPGDKFVSRGRVAIVQLREDGMVYMQSGDDKLSLPDEVLLQLLVRPGATLFQPRKVTIESLDYEDDGTRFNYNFGGWNGTLFIPLAVASHKIAPRWAGDSLEDLAFRIYDITHNPPQLTMV